MCHIQTTVASSQLSLRSFTWRVKGTEKLRFQPWLQQRCHCQCMPLKILWDLGISILSLTDYYQPKLGNVIFKFCKTSSKWYSCPKFVIHWLQVIQPCLKIQQAHTKFNFPFASFLTSPELKVVLLCCCEERSYGVVCIMLSHWQQAFLTLR